VVERAGGKERGASGLPSKFPPLHPGENIPPSRQANTIHASSGKLDGRPSMLVCMRGQ